MPYLVAASSQVPEEPNLPQDSDGTGGSDPGTIPSVPVVVETARVRISITTSDGTVFDLSDPTKIVATRGRRGFDAAVYDMFTDETSGSPGELYRGQRATARDIILPVHLYSGDRPGFLALRREFLGKLPRGLNTLTVAESNGTSRFIDFVYTGRGAEGEGVGGWRHWTQYNLELRCPNPYWRGDVLKQVWQAPDSTPFYPILPLRVQSGQTFGATRFTNPGDVECYGVWTIEGPASGITLTRTTLDPTLTLTLNSTLSAGQKRIVDTRPGKLSVTDEGGVNKFAEVQAGTWPWELTPGENLLDVTIGGFNTNTKVTLEAEPLYESL